jgi:hypothetical protein
MDDPIFAEFPPAEQEQRRKINALMEDWANGLAGVQVEPGDGESYPGSEVFCPDGFYPYYYRQKRKILFIAREPLSISGCDCIGILLKAYRENLVDGATLNQHNFHKRLMWITWGILQGGTVPYAQVPKASDLGKTFGTPEGISFAFMELSKYSNDSKSGPSHRDTELMTAFLKDSRLEKRNFFREELAILDPDVVITMNLWEAGVDRALVDLALGKVAGDWGSSDYPPPGASGFIEINGKQVPLLNLPHFSYVENTEEYFYKPAMKMITDLARGAN